MSVHDQPQLIRAASGDGKSERERARRPQGRFATDTGKRDAAKGVTVRVSRGFNGACMHGLRKCAKRCTAGRRMCKRGKASTACRSVFITHRALISDAGARASPGGWSRARRRTHSSHVGHASEPCGQRSTQRQTPSSRPRRPTSCRESSVQEGKPCRILGAKDTGKAWA